MNKKPLILLSIMFLPLLLFFAYTWGTLHYSYSSGERVGQIQKFSKKGWVFKTWEGELAMTPVPGAIPEKFLFSIRDNEVAKKVNQLLSRKVSLSYEQHMGVPTSFFGETQYFVIGVRAVD